VQVTGQYRTVWTHAARVVEGPSKALVAGLLDTAAGSVRAGGALAVGAAPADAQVDVRWVNQADLATFGEYARGAAPLVAGAIGAVVVEVVFADGGYLTAAETVEVGVDGAERLTAPKAVAP
jgi:hypothetical protein